MNGKLKKLTDENEALRASEAGKVGRRNDEGATHQRTEDDLEHHRACELSSQKVTVFWYAYQRQKRG